MIINIRDVNDLPPAFLDQSYETTVFEETVHDQTHILKVGLPVAKFLKTNLLVFPTDKAAIFNVLGNSAEISFV